MNTLTQLSQFKKEFDRELTKFLTRKINQAKKIDPKVASLVEQIKNMVSAGGKRLRPAFCYFSYKACGGKNEEAILYTSQAIELGHTFALIHDDIIDKAQIRRKKPTIFKVAGLPTAILVGDLAFCLAEEVFTTAPFKDDLIREAKKYFDLSKFEVLGGEYLDVLATKEETVDEEKIMKILEYKSGKYTIERPLHLGAALTEAPEEVFKVFSRYGIPLGIAFQIKDDILGMFGKEEVIGKPVDSDLREGKRTLLIIQAVKRIKNKQQKEKLLSLLGNKKATRKDLEWVRNLIKETGSLEYSQNLAKELIREAKMAIRGYPFKKEGKDFLIGIADYIIERRN